MISFFKKRTNNQEIICYKENIWGLSFVVDKPTEVYQKCKGDGFHPNRSKIKPGVLVCKQYDDGFGIYKIEKVTYCKDPKDMFFWEGIRVSVKDLTENETEYIIKWYNMKG